MDGWKRYTTGMRTWWAASELLNEAGILHGITRAEPGPGDSWVWSASPEAAAWLDEHQGAVEDRIVLREAELQRRGGTHDTVGG